MNTRKILKRSVYAYLSLLSMSIFFCADAMYVVQRSAVNHKVKAVIENNSIVELGKFSLQTIGDANVNNGKESHTFVDTVATQSGSDAASAILAMCPKKVQKCIVEYLLPHNADARERFHKNDFADSLYNYAESQVIASSSLNKLPVDDFFNLDDQERKVLIKLHEHFKQPEVVSVDVSMQEYETLMRLDKKFKSVFHNDEEFFTAKVKRTPKQKVLYVTANGAYYALCGTVFATGVSYFLKAAMQEAKQTISDIEKTIIATAEQSALEGAKNSLAQGNPQKAAKEEAAKEFQSSLNKHLDDYFNQTPDELADSDLVEKVVEATIKSGINGAKGGVTGYSNALKNDTIMTVKSDTITAITDLIIYKAKNLPQLLFESAPTPCTENVKDGLQYGGLAGLVYGTLSGLWNMNAPTVEKNISKI